MKFTISILSIFLFFSCNHEHRHESNHTHDHNSTEHAHEHDNESQSEPIDIIGKTIEYRYGESVYHVHIDNETEMHWEAVAGDEKGVEEEETYKLHRLDNNTIFITWGEANGIGVSQVLDFKEGKVYNHLLRGRDVSIGTGEIRILEE